MHAVADIYDELSRDVPFLRIHGDCHQGNLLKGDDGFFFLDFDDFLCGPAVQDLWMLLPVTDREGLRQRELLLEGYRLFRDFDPSWLRLIEPLRALRYIHYAGWIACRWEDPAFPKIFPHFGTHEYWENETSDLEKQLTLIKNFEESSAHLMTHDEPDRKDTDDNELTNKDFFWNLDE
ncbi:MAG: phosphotransferase [Spirochaetota bacterium]